MCRLLALIGFVVTSCAPAYISNVRNTPMLEQANQVSAAVSFATSGGDLQLAYALTDHFAIMANGNYLDREEIVTGDYRLRHKHLFGEGAIGYFIKTDRVHFEMFSGYGAARFKSFQTFLLGDPDFVHATYNRFFFQPSIRIGHGDFEFMFTPRISIVDVKDYKLIEADTGEVRYPVINGVQGYFEPAFTGRFDITDQLYGFCQVGFNIPMNGPYYYDQNTLQFAFGFQFRTFPKHDD